jgi:Hint domain
MVADKVLSSDGPSGTDSMTEQFATVGQRGFAIALNCAPVCFMAGTLIRTPDGQVEIEKIARGDFVMTVDGRRAQVGWVGRQTVCMHFADPLRARPVRIKANALAENVPSRDLLVSPDHAILVDNILVQAGALVNVT